MTLVRAKYLSKQADGTITEIFCKVCGTNIARATPDGRMVRRPNYTEIKMKFSDGSFHVTNLCKSCVENIGDRKDVMLDMYEADIDEMSLEAPQLLALKGKSYPELVSVMLGNKGII